MTSPLVSVILPTYNRARLLPRAVRSVLCQTHSNLELIVIDDGSDDNTPATIASFDDPRVRALRRERSQLAGNEENPRNLGVEAARGDYLCFLDDDDAYRPEFVERLVSHLEADPRLGLVYCDSVFHREERGREVATVNRSVDFDRGLLERVNFVSTTEIMVRTSCAREVGGWDTHIKRGSDHAFVLRISERYPVLHVAEVLADNYWGRDEPCQRSQVYWDVDFVPKAEVVVEPNACFPWAPQRPSRQQLAYVSYSDLARDTLDLARGLPKDRYRAVYAVPRSGVAPAGILATELHLPLGVVGAEGEFSGSRLRELAGNATPGEAVLLVDDSISTGGSLARARERLREAGITNVETCAVYAAPASRAKVDHYARVVPAPRIFRWNLWGSARTSRLMCDLDGVFAADPPVFDDDGPRYAHALKHAPLLSRPLTPVHSIVTNRLERWKALTTDWLERHGIEFGALHMQAFATAAERRAAGDYGRWKGEVYGGSDALLFVESSEAQARRIHEVSGRPVLSLETERLYA